MNVIKIILISSEPIWYKIKKTVECKLREYTKMHTLMVTHWHRDDGDLAMIYYPRCDWTVDWGGGTAIYDNEVKDIDRHFRKQRKWN